MPWEIDIVAWYQAFDVRVWSTHLSVAFHARHSMPSPSGIWCHVFSAMNEYMIASVERHEELRQENKCKLEKFAMLIISSGPTAAWLRGCDLLTVKPAVPPSKRSWMLMTLAPFQPFHHLPSSQPYVTLVSLSQLCSMLPFVCEPKLKQNPNLNQLHLPTP